jgi:hypothetical protein
MRAQWIVVSLVIWLSVPAEGLAQPVIQPTDGKLVVKSTVDPAPAAVPALKYLLLPELRDQQPGNQVQAFCKCFAEQHNFYHDPSEIAKREKWSAAPLADLAGEKGLGGYGGSGLRQADFAARLESVDWGILVQFRSEGINLLLPDVQQLRELAAALKVRARGEIARKEYAAALHTLQTMFALAATFNQHPTLVGQLVGIAILNLTLGVVEEFQQQPGTPNLYWALADLPAPFVDLRKGMQGERLWLPKDYDLLRKAEPIPEAVLDRRVKELTEWVTSGSGEGGRKRTPASEYYASRAGNPATVTAMKESLAALGHKPADLDRLSPRQIAMMDDYARYERYRDDLMKWTNLPYWELPADLAKHKQPDGILPELAPAAVKVIQSRARVQQYLSLLQAVEAVRMYAAENQGKLPASLAETKVPVPVDPVTGKSFLYEAAGRTAVIRGTAPSDRKNDPSFNRVYEVSIRQ